MNEKKEMTEKDIAEYLLYPIWSGVSADFKKKFKGDTWGIFENFLKTSACNANLKQFYDKLKRLLPMMLTFEQEKAVLSVLNSGYDELVLEKLRTECAYLVLLTRSMNEERKQVKKDENNRI